MSYFIIRKSLVPISEKDHLFYIENAQVIYILYQNSISFFDLKKYKGYDFFEQKKSFVNKIALFIYGIWTIAISGDIFILKEADSAQTPKIDFLYFE